MDIQDDLNSSLPATIATGAPGLSEPWRRCCERLRAELGENVFSSWFGRLTLDQVSGGHAQLSVPTRFLKSWIETHYGPQLLSTLNAEIGAVVAVAISVRSSTRPEASERCASPRAERQPAEREAAADEAHAEAAPKRPVARGASVAASIALAGSPLDRRLTFSTFQIGRSNQLAYSAALRVAEGGAGKGSTFSPLFVHSAVGLGKTHLLQGVAHAASAQGRGVIYLTAEKFMYGFVAALQSQTSIAFKERLRAIDLLIFDDAQFLQGKAIQNEFGHALNALLDAGRDVIVAADRPPNDLEALDDRVRSRLAGGLCVEIAALDEALRLKILEARLAAARVAHPSFDVSPQVLAFVARSIRSNGRDLEGAVNRLLAHSTLNGVPLSVEAAEAAIRDLIRTHEPKRVRIEDIQKLVASHYSVSRADILSSRRTAVVVKPRQVAMFLSKTLTLRSLPEIGRRFGGRDHTTVLHAVRKIEGLCGSDATLREELELLKRMLLD